MMSKMPPAPAGTVQPMPLLETEAPFAGAGMSLYRRSFQPESGWARLAILHGYGDHAGRYSDFMRWMAGHGIACHALDFRGHGKAGGRRGYVRSWAAFLDDLRLFLSLPQVQQGNGPLMVLGHSHGGLVAAMGGIEGILSQAGVSGCILSSPYLLSMIPVSLPWRALAHLFDWVWPWLAVPTGLRSEAMTSDPAISARSRNDPLVNHIATPRWFLETMRVQEQIRRRAGQFTLPLFCLAGDKDSIADPAACEEFVRRAHSTDKRFKLYPDRLHELLHETERERVFADVLSWMRARAPGP
jgi:alpha-beta hydrolase superfamily lysophospholipase